MNHALLSRFGPFRLVYQFGDDLMTINQIGDFLATFGDGIIPSILFIFITDAFDLFTARGRAWQCGDLR